MPSLRKTAGGSYIACFRYSGRQYQRSLKTSDLDAAKAAMGLIVNRLYKLDTGDLKIPAGIDAGDFITNRQDANGKADNNNNAVEQEGDTDQNDNVVTPSIDDLVDEYLKVHRRLKAESTLRTERTHLNTLQRVLGSLTKLPADQIQDSYLDSFLSEREEQVEPVTVLKERQTVMQLFDWAVKKKKLLASPATDLRKIQAGPDRDHFRTLAEVEEIVERGGLSDEEVLQHWECLYLTLWTHSRFAPGRIKRDTRRST